MRRFLLFCITLLTGFISYGQVTFSASFESGSVGEVTLIDSATFVVSPSDTVQHLSYLVRGHFDPLNPVDTALRPSADWYYFQVNGVKGKQIYLNFPDNGVPRTSFSTDGGQSWNHLPMAMTGWHKASFRLDCDSVRIALFEPYNYSYLQKRLCEWASCPDVTVDTIGMSFEGRPLQLLTISDGSVPSSLKKRVWIHGRIHPSETPGSWMLDGLISRLTDDSKEASGLRKSFEFYILPFTNPDGVANGLSRSNHTGVNQEINYGRSDDSTVVEVKAIKAALTRLTSARPLDLLVNSHSQHDSFATFWMHTAASTSQRYQGMLWTLAGLTCSMNPYIEPRDMSFASVAPRYVEGWIWDRFGERTPAITIETPYNCYSSNYEGEWATKDNMRAFGESFLFAIADYFETSTPGRVIVEAPSKVSPSWENADDSISYMGENAYIAVSDGARMKYRTSNLPAGKYKLYKYTSGANIAPSKGSFFTSSEDPGIHGWQYVCDVEQKRDGSWTYRIKVEKGSVADALLLLKQ